MRNAILLAALLVGACSTSRDAHFRNGPPSEGLTELIASADQPLRIVFLHGMRATRSGGSKTFREALCARLQGCKGPSASQTVRIKLPQVEVSYLGAPVWRDAAEWDKSAPILHRYVYGGANGATVVVEEVNWWPLLHPIKCRFIVKGDAPLVGVSKDALDVCAARGVYADEEHHAWLTGPEADEIAAKAGVTGGGAMLNRVLKTEIMDWGLADAVIATGPLGEILGQGVGAAFAWSASTPIPGTQPGQAPPRYVLVSESLGSFIAFDYYERHYGRATVVATDDAQEAATARAAFGLMQVVDNADRLSFLANQIALLELARPEVKSGPTGALQEPSAARGFRRWAGKTKPGGAEALGGSNYGEVVAFHDPSDILTFEVPAVPGASVRNVFLANGPTYLGMLAEPGRAHTAHSRNSCVLQIMFDKRPNGPCKVAKARPDSPSARF